MLLQRGTQLADLRAAGEHRDVPEAVRVVALQMLQLDGHRLHLDGTIGACSTQLATRAARATSSGGLPTGGRRLISSRAALRTASAQR